MIRGLTELCFPRVCAVCGKYLCRSEEVLCVPCLSDLPKTFFWEVPNNAVELCFLGRVPFERAASFLFFRSGSAYQQLLHAFKYHGVREAGEFMGQLFGRELAHSAWAKERYTLVPVPLHPHKAAQRGYNQSESIARGIASQTFYNINTTLLRRAQDTPSQTHRDRVARWTNVCEAFESVPWPQNQGPLPPLLLVDDVITTGATLESCAQAILRANPTARLSFCSLAYVE